MRHERYSSLDPNVNKLLNKGRKEGRKGQQNGPREGMGSKENICGAVSEM